ncbi:MAG: hypothetical protein ACTSXC_03555, partial [Candidatus Freyarchaeota archaeon]
QRIRLYQVVMKLRGQGLGPRRISKTLKERYGISLSQGVICSWLYCNQHPLGRCNKIKDGPDLAYVIASWIGDGFRSKDQKRSHYNIMLGVTDYDFAAEWGRRVAKALGRSSPYRPYWEKKRKIWIVKARSILLYRLLEAVKKGYTAPEKYLRETSKRGL